MSITWLRHAKKKYKNKDNLGEFKHDSPIVDGCEKDIENFYTEYDELFNKKK